MGNNNDYNGPYDVGAKSTQASTGISGGGGGGGGLYWRNNYSVRAGATTYILQLELFQLLAVLLVRILIVLEVILYVSINLSFLILVVGE